MNNNDQSVDSGDKREEKTEEKSKSSPSSGPFSPVFHIKEFKVGNLENASAINIGNNYPTDFKGYKRHSQGLGTIEGNHNDIHDLNSHMNQRLLMDAIMDYKEDLPSWLTDLLYEYSDDGKDEGPPISSESSSILKDMTKLLDIEHPSSFFKQLARKEDVIRDVWDVMQQKWTSSQEFDSFYYDILSILNKYNLYSLPSNHPTIEQTLCESIANIIEEQSKTLLVILFLMNQQLPEFITKEEKAIFGGKVKPIESHEPNEIIKAIKEEFKLDEVPSFLSKLKSNPQTLAYAYHNIIQPVGNSKEVIDYSRQLHNLFNKKAEEFNGSFKIGTMKPENQSFLLTQLIYYFDVYPKTILLGYLLIPLCE